MRDARIMLVGYSPDGSRLVVANSWGEFQLWDTATGQAASPPISPGLSVSVGFSPDGALLLTGSSDGTARVWRAADGAPLGPPVLHGTRLRSVDFDATGSRLVTVSHANSARVWDVHTRQPLTEPLMHPVRLFGATFSPDGRFLRSETVLTPQAPTTFWLWSLPPPLAPGETTPEWLLQLATVCSTKRVDGSGQCVDAPESIAQIEDVRRALAALPADAFLAEWGRWILDDRADRPIAPGFAITPAQAEELKARFGAVALP
jgi:hypothetical protein